ncbi:hypothetical protein NECAME_01577 [Necator americanus]|uniref:FLYWCH zinc finger domain protein n=1 Tax=Necator americanus TaxID=51031 RepID=W2TSH1_NECAM|nr:hypothetical protein NECAME_01577 [Necator americanus]ETN85015.1 hypothetical protein NECAME_01577 [Necator americanus]
MSQSRPRLPAVAEFFFATLRELYAYRNMDNTMQQEQVNTSTAASSTGSTEQLSSYSTSGKTFTALVPVSEDFTVPQLYAPSSVPAVKSPPLVVCEGMDTSTEPSFATSYLVLPQQLPTGLPKTSSQVSSSAETILDSNDDVIHTEPKDSPMEFVEVVQKSETPATDASLETIQKSETSATDASLETIQKVDTPSTNSLLEAIVQSDTPATNGPLEAIVKSDTTATDGSLETVVKPDTPAADGSPKAILNSETPATDISMEPVLKSDTPATDVSLDVVLKSDTPTTHVPLGPIPSRKLFSAINLPSKKGTHILIYNIANSDNCYVFQTYEVGKEVRNYRCVGKYSSGTKCTATVMGSENHFYSDPTKLDHKCIPRSLLQEISMRTKRTVYNPSWDIHEKRRSALRARENLVKDESPSNKGGCSGAQSKSATRTPMEKPK